MAKHHLVYKITNNLNGKYYIGIHSTEIIEDGYMGSGTSLKIAIKRYGMDNFTRQILCDFETREKASDKEAELITIKEVKDENCYNLTVGGGGFIPIGIYGKPKVRPVDESYTHWFYSRSFFKLQQKDESEKSKKSKSKCVVDFDKEYKYIFKSNQEGVAEFQSELYNMPQSMYTEITLISLAYHDELCELLTDTYNDKSYHDQASGLMRQLLAKNYHDLFIITKEKINY